MMAALATCRPSPANMTTSTASFSTVEVPFSGMPLLTLQQFDGSLGTLTDVSFSLTASIVASGNVTFEVPKGASCTISEVSTGYSLTAASDSPSPLASVSFSPLVYNNKTLIGSKTGFSTGTQGFDFIDAPPMYTAADYNLTTNPTNLDTFEGTGTYSFVPAASISVSFSPSNEGFIITDYTFAEATITVTYTYTPVSVPEPSSQALVGIASCLIGGRLARNRLRAGAQAV